MVARVNALADGIEGFVWRLQDDSGNAIGHEGLRRRNAWLPNLTVWENIEALERFVWKTVHSRFYGRRAEWFEADETPLVLWQVPAGHRPTMAEGVERRDHLRAHGASDYAFGWETMPASAIGKTARCARCARSKPREERALDAAILT